MLIAYIYLCYNETLNSIKVGGYFRKIREFVCVINLNKT